MSTYNNNNYLYEFDVKANFYKIEGMDMIFRNLLNIKRKYIESNNIDATFIIMNPQCSKLKNNEENKRIPIYTVEDLLNKNMPIIFKEYVANKNELYIMKIMDNIKWNNVNVISLSDIISIDKAEFKYKECLLKEIYKDYEDIHSIFNKNRKDVKYFIERNRPVVCIWGMNCRGLSNKAETYFNDNEIEIISVKNKKGHYYNLRTTYFKRILGTLIENIRYEESYKSINQ